MNKIFKYGALTLLSSLAIVACNKSAPEKDSVESGFSASAGLPSVSLDMTNYEYDNVAGYATVTATFSGITAAMDSVELGFLSSTDDSFYTSNFVEVNPSDGTYTADVKIVAGTTNYVVACASTTDGTNFSDVLAIEVADIEWYKKLPITFVADVTGASGDAYSGTAITVTYDSENNLLELTPFDPYLASLGYSTTVYAELGGDLENPSASVVMEDGGYFSLNSNIATKYSLIGLPLSDDASSFTDELLITFPKDMTSMTINPWCLYQSGKGWWEIYYATTYTAQ